jgi:hypothetical protein
MGKFARPFIGGMEGGRLRTPVRPASPRPVLPTAMVDRPLPSFALASNFLPVPSTGAPARPTTKISRDTFDLIMKCAVDERQAALRFQRSEANPKHFLIREILTWQAIVMAAADQSKGHTYRDNGIFFEDATCPYCSTPGGTLYCYSCGSLICRGRITETENGVFARCTPSCGASGVLRLYRTPSRTVDEPRICIGHVSALAHAARNGGTSRFFDCCGSCDLSGGHGSSNRGRS